MAGLLDWMEKNPALTQGLLGGAFGLLGGRGTRLQAIGQGGMAGLSAYANAKQDETQNRFRDLQTQSLQGQVEQQRMERERQQQLRALPGQFMRSPAQQALAGGGGPTMANAQKMDGAQSVFDINGYAEALMAIDPVQAIQLKASLRKENTPLKLSQGEVAIDPQTGKQLFANPKAPDLPSAVQEYQFAVGQGYKGSFNDWDTSRRRAAATNVNVPVNMGQKGFDNTLKLRGDFRSEPVYKAHQEMQSAYSQIQQSLKQGTPAGDLAGATKIMKLLDPGSVVRESELGMAMAATGLADRVGNYANMIITGQKLTPTQRKEFQALADALYGESVKAYTAKRAEYGGISDRNGLNTADVLGPEPAMPKPSSDGWSIKPVGK